MKEDEQLEDIYLASRSPLDEIGVAKKTVHASSLFHPLSISPFCLSLLSVFFSFVFIITFPILILQLTTQNPVRSSTTFPAFAFLSGRRTSSSFLYSSRASRCQIHAFNHRPWKEKKAAERWFLCLWRFSLGPLLYNYAFFQRE